MMAKAHPDELALLAYVDGEATQPWLAEHVAACAACAEQVRHLEAGRNVLRASPRLQLPPERREAILAGLPEREPKRTVSRRRLVAILAPVAVVAALVAVVATVERQPGGLGGGGDEEGAAPAAEAEAPTAGQMEQAEGAQDYSRAPTPVRSVAGSPQDVAALLREKGFEVRIVNSTVEVRHARTAAVLSALKERPRGAVVVLVR